jgi:hypothetical protein
MSSTDDETPTPTAYDMPIERGKIREFARSTGSDRREYLDDDEAPIPPTFLRTAAFWQPPDAVSPLSGAKLNLSRILHGEQEYVFFGPPPHAGQTLHVQPRLESITEKEGKRGGTMRVITTVEDFTDDDGNLVAQSRSTLIETGKAPS